MKCINRLDGQLRVGRRRAKSDRLSAADVKQHSCARDCGRQPANFAEWLAKTNDSAIDEFRTPPRLDGPHVNRLAYINLESNNGAIVLNVSNGGLCFHSVDPVRRSETIHFWFLDHNHRIEADGRLAWMDETQKTGGLQFTALPTEARLQIRDWISQPAAPRTAGGKSAHSHSSTSELQTFSASHLRQKSYA